MSVGTYYVTVESLPEINARIFINGEDTGKSTPYTFALPKGTYTFKVEDQTGKYLFSEWWKDNIFFASIPEVTIIVDADMLLEARFVVAPTPTPTTAVATATLQLAFVLIFMVVLMEVVRSVRFRG